MSNRDTRNLNPHAEARIAMVIWSHEYAFEQRGGCVDFWDSLSPWQKRQCVELVDRIISLPRAALAATEGEKT